MKMYKIPIIGIDMPFDKEAYLSTWKKLILPYVAIGLVLIMVIWNEILFQDVLGLVFTSLIVAYIWHLIVAFEGE